MANSTLTLSQALSRAVSAYNAGKFVEAERICQQIVNAKRDLFDALHLLAVVQSRLGKTDTALASFDRALKARPDSAEALCNRGNALRELKRFEEALALKLAREPVALRELKTRLMRNRDTYPLFDSDRFRRNIEAAYLQMWEVWQQGGAPRQIALSG